MLVKIRRASSVNAPSVARVTLLMRPMHYIRKTIMYVCMHICICMYVCMYIYVVCNVLVLHSL